MGGGRCRERQSANRVEVDRREEDLREARIHVELVVGQEGQHIHFDLEEAKQAVDTLADLEEVQVEVRKYLKASWSMYSQLPRGLVRGVVMLGVEFYSLSMTVVLLLNHEPGTKIKIMKEKQ